MKLFCSFVKCDEEFCDEFVLHPCEFFAIECLKKHPQYKGRWDDIVKSMLLLTEFSVKYISIYLKNITHNVVTLLKYA